MISPAFQAKGSWNLCSVVNHQCVVAPHIDGLEDGNLVLRLCIANHSVFFFEFSRLVMNQNPANTLLSIINQKEVAKRALKDTF